MRCLPRGPASRCVKNGVNTPFATILQMTDVIVRFPKPPPRQVRLRGEVWTLSIIPTRPKSTKHWALLASCATDHREHVVCTAAGSPDALRNKLAEGFLVRGGTSLRGMVTELRRAGLVALDVARPLDA